MRSLTAILVGWVPKMHPDQSTTRFTLRDLLTATGILAAAAFLVLPLIQKFGEKDRRARCLNNLRQIAIACQTHQTTTGDFPPLYGWVGPPDQGGSAHGTAFYHLLPYVGAANKFSRGLRGAPTGSVFDMESTGVARQRIRAYECQSDPSLPGSGTLPNGFAPCSYALNAEVFAAVAPDGSLDHGADGEPGTASPFADPAAYARTPDSFGDGGAQTAIVTERYARCWILGNSWSFPYSTTAPEAWAPYFAGRRNDGGPSAVGDGTGYVLPLDYVAKGLKFPAACRFQVHPDPFSSQCNPHQPNTGHAHAINIACADGSSCPVSSNVGAAVWWAYVTPNGHDVGRGDW